MNKTQLILIFNLLTSILTFGQGTNSTNDKFINEIEVLGGISGTYAFSGLNVKRTFFENEIIILKMHVGSYHRYHHFLNYRYYPSFGFGAEISAHLNQKKNRFLGLQVTPELIMKKELGGITLRSYYQHQISSKSANFSLKYYLGYNVIGPFSRKNGYDCGIALSSLLNITKNQTIKRNNDSNELASKTKTQNRNRVFAEMLGTTAIGGNYERNIFRKYFDWNASIGFMISDVLYHSIGTSIGYNRWFLNPVIGAKAFFNQDNAHVQFWNARIGLDFRVSKFFYAELNYSRISFTANSSDSWNTPGIIIGACF